MGCTPSLRGRGTCCAVTMAAETVTVNVVFTAECCEKLIEAAELIRDMAADYPDDMRFQDVVDRIVDAVGLSQPSAAE